MTEPTEKPTPPVSRKSLLIAAGIVTTSLIAWPVYNSLTRPPAPPSAAAQNEGRIAPPHPAAVETAPGGTAEPEKTAKDSAGAASPEAVAPPAPAESATTQQPGQAASPARPAATAGATERAKPATAQASPATSVQPPARTSEKPVVAPPAKTGPRETAAPASQAAPKTVAKEVAAPKQPMESRPAAQSRTASPPPPVPYRVAPPTEVARPDGSSVGYRVQLGLFSNIDNAAALVQRLKKAGIAAQSETRVSVGPFTTRAEADEAMAQLKGMGLTPLLAPNGTQ